MPASKENNSTQWLTQWKNAHVIVIVISKKNFKVFLPPKSMKRRYCVVGKDACIELARAGHLLYFLIFSIIKNDSIAFLSN